MGFLLSNSGEKEVLRNITQDTLSLHLFANDVIVSKDLNLENLEEVTGGGYSPKELESLNWILTSNSKDVNSLTYPTQFWNFKDKVGNVYGYFVAKQTITGQKLMWSQKFEEGPFDIQIAGDVIKLTPIIELGNNS